MELSIWQRGVYPAMAVEIQALQLFDFSGGINVFDPPHLIKDNEAVELRDVILTRQTGLQAREGYSKYTTQNLYGKAINLWRYYATSPCFLLAWQTYDYTNPSNPVPKDVVLYKTTGDTWTAINTWTSTQRNLFIGKQVEVPNANFLFLSDGQTDVWKFDGSNLYLAGIAAPTSAPTLAYNSTGQIPAGTYYYRITFMGLNKTCESSPGPQVSITTTSTGSIDLSNIPVSSDPQCSYKRIYRSRVNDPSAFYFVAEIPNSQTTYNDNTLDSDLGTEMEWERNRPQPCKAMEWHKGRLWYSKGDNRIYWSKAWQPQEFGSLSYIDLTLDPEDYIVGLVSYANNLIVLCRYSLWQIVGDEPSQFTAMKIPFPIGCVGYQAWTLTPFGVVFLSDEGIYIYDGQLRDIGRNISPYIQKLYPDKTYLRLYYFPHPYYPCILFPYNSKLQQRTLSTLVYFIALNSWVEWSIQEPTFVVDESNLYFIRDDIYQEGVGYMFKYGGATDDGKPLGIHCLTKIVAPVDGLYDAKGIRIHLTGRMTRGDYFVGIITDETNYSQLSFSTDYVPAYFDESNFDETHFGEQGPWNFNVAVPTITGRMFQFLLQAISSYKNCSIDKLIFLYRPIPRRMEVVKR